VPPELLASLSAKVSPENLSTKCVQRLEDAAIEYVEEVEELLDQSTDLAKLIAYQRVKELVASGSLNETTLRETRQAIARDIEVFESMLAGNAQTRKGGVAA
jgi:hypothetical protein